MIYAEKEGCGGKVGSENTSNFSSEYTNVCTEWQLCGRCRNKSTQSAASGSHGL